MPTRGPTITPAIQVLLFDDGLGGGVRFVGCGVYVLDEALLEEVVAMLEEVGTADVAPVHTLAQEYRVQSIGHLLLDRLVTVLEAFTRPLILNPGDDICCVYGSVESKKVKRNTQKSSAENAVEAMLTFQS
jgi:hypothetical protein